MLNSLDTWFRRQSVARKLMTTLMATGTITMAVAISVFATYDYVNSRSRLVRDITMLADIVGTNSTAALTFKDATSAAETLRATAAANEHVLAARLFTHDGALLATYWRPGFPPRYGLVNDLNAPPEAVALFEGDRLRVV